MTCWVGVNELVWVVGVVVLVNGVVVVLLEPPDVEITCPPLLTSTSPLGVT